MEFQEKYNIQTIFSTGATVAQASPFYPVAGYRRTDFYLTGLSKKDASGALGGTAAQKFYMSVVQASNSTGGGTLALSSATAIAGKDSATGVSSGMKCREGLVFFSTMTSGLTYSISVGTAVYLQATATAAGNQYTVASAAAATSAAQAFVTMFNSTVNNTATAITANWYAATMAAGVPWVKILPKDVDGTHLLTLGSTVSSLVGVGGVFKAHIGVDSQFVTDGKTHLAVKVYSTADANPYSVMVVREAEYRPTKAVMVEKTINQSTSK